MGNVLFRRKTSAEELEDLHKRTTSLWEEIQDDVKNKNYFQVTTTVTLISLVAICIAVFLVTVEQKSRKISYSIFAVVLGIFLTYLVNRIVCFCFGWSIERKKNALDKLIQQKKMLLEKIKETETFKVAKELLDKFGDETGSSYHSFNTAHVPKQSECITSSENRGESAQKHELHPTSQNRHDPSSVELTPLSRSGSSSASSSSSFTKQPTSLKPRMSLRPARPYIRQSRSFFEKILDVIIGDGPNNRYALICIHCGGHNGMAFKDECDFLAYRCWNCGGFNPARRQRSSNANLETGFPSLHPDRSTSSGGTPSPNKVNSHQSVPTETDSNKRVSTSTDNEIICVGHSRTSSSDLDKLDDFAQDKLGSMLTFEKN